MAFLEGRKQRTEILCRLLGSGLGERSGCGRSFRSKNLGLGCDNGPRHGLWRNRLNRRNRLNDGFGVRRSLRLRCSHNFGNRLRDGFRRVFGGGHGFFDVFVCHGCLHNHSPMLASGR